MSIVSRMVAFVGDQPAPVALVALHYGAGDTTLVASKRTEQTAQRVQKLLESEGKNAQIVEVEDPYCLESVESAVCDLPPEGVFNLTGGTKPMMIGGYRVSERHKLPFVYLESESGVPVLWRYEWDQGLRNGVKETIHCPLTIEQPLKLFGIDKRPQKDPTPFEKQLAAKVAPYVCESLMNVWLADNVEVDLILRCGHTLAVAELFDPTGKNAKFKPKIDQLVQATEPTRLGTYTRRILITSKELDEQNAALAELARVKVILANDEHGCVGRRVAECLGASQRQ